jgi:hypothetical protein
MKLLLSIFNFKKFFFGICFGIFLIFLGSFITNYLIEHSNHRLSKIYSSQLIESSIFFVGNSRSVPFNSDNLKTSKKVLNLSQNSMNSFEVENIIKAIKKKKQSKKIIYIELTSLVDDSIQCQYSIFYDLKFYFGKESIRQECKRILFLENLIPIAKINNELFYRIFFYYIFPKKDQQWTNQYTMPNTVCANPKTTPLIDHFFSNDSKNKMYKKSTDLLRAYSDSNTEIFFFIAPIYQKNNLAFFTEEEFLKQKNFNLIKLNTLLNKKFFKDCNMFADTLHLSSIGVNFIKENNIFFD